MTKMRIARHCGNFGMLELVVVLIACAMLASLLPAQASPSTPKILHVMSAGTPAQMVASAL